VLAAAGAELSVDVPVAVDPEEVPVVPLVEVLDGIGVVSDGIVVAEVLPCPVVVDVDVPLVDEPEGVVSVTAGVPVEDVVLGMVAELLGIVAELLGVVAPRLVGSVAPVEPDVWANDAPMAVTSAAAAAAVVKLFGSLVILILL